MKIYSVFDNTNINIVSILRSFIIIDSILIIAIKIIAFIVTRNRSTFKQKENIIISEKSETQKQQSMALELAAVNFSVIIILCLCVVVFFLVQSGYRGNNICHYDLTEYCNLLLVYLLSISFIAPDIDKLFKTNIVDSIIFTRWFKTFESIVLALYIPIIISLMVICR